MAKKEKIVLAYSGGLDTSCILKWLLEQGHEVVAYIADVGQRDDFDVARERALAVGACEVIVDDLKREFVTDFILPAFSAGATYEGRYLLGTSLARPLIARGQIQAGQRVGATVMSHGATGKGNDQVRFELAYYALDPEISVFAPWRHPPFLDQFQGRPDLIAYAEQHQLPVPVTRAKPYSEDENLLHISHEGGILEDPAHPAAEVLSWISHPTQAPDAPQQIRLTFKDGLPVKLEDQASGETWTDPLELFQALNALGAKHGIGLLDMVENRFIGIKSRGVYETPGGAILHELHQDLEGVAMDREVLRLRNQLGAKFAELIYNGFWYSPEMDFLMGAIERSQEVIDGSVTASLYKGNVLIEGRESPASLYDSKLSSMDIEGGFDQKDSEGFIRINAVRLKAHAAIMKRTTGKTYLPEE